MAAGIGLGISMGWTYAKGSPWSHCKQEYVCYSSKARSQLF